MVNDNFYNDSSNLVNPDGPVLDNLLICKTALEQFELHSVKFGATAANDEIIVLLRKTCASLSKEVADLGYLAMK